MSKNANVWRNLGLTLGTLSLIAVGSGCSKKKKKSTDADPTVAVGTVVSAGGGASNTAAAALTDFSLKGVLALTSATSSSSSLRLTASETTVTCTDAADAANVLTATVDADTGEYTLQAAPELTQGKTFNCALDNGDVVTDLPAVAIPADASAADASTTLDGDTGANSNEVTYTKTSGEVVGQDDVYVALPAALMAMDVTGVTGPWTVKQCGVDKGKRRNVRQGDVAGAGLDGDTCEGFEQGLYFVGVNGVAGTASPVVPDQAPRFEVWNSKEAYDACHVGGALSMSIQDKAGHAVDFTTPPTAAALYAAIKEFGWAPAPAIARAEAAAATNNAPPKPEAAQIRGVLTTAYGEGKECSGFASDLAKDWSKVTTVVKKGGRKVCSDFKYESLPEQMQTMLNRELAQKSGDGGGLADMCGPYAESKTAGQREQALNRFVVECTKFLTGKPGEQERDQAKNDVVDTFLNSLGRLKYESNSQDKRLKPLKDSLAGIDLDSPQAASDAQLETFARRWSEVSWDWMAKKKLSYAVASMAAAISGSEPWVGVEGQTGRAVILAMLADENSKTNLEQQLCSGQGKSPSLTDLYAAGSAALTAYEAAVDAGTQQSDADWKSSVTYAQKKSLLTGLADAMLALTVLDPCERTKFKTMKLQAQQAQEGQGNHDPVAEAPRMLGHDLTEAKLNAKFQLLGAMFGDPDANGQKPTDPSYSDDAAAADLAALDAAVTDAASVDTQRFSWLAQEKQRWESDHLDAKGKLFRLTQVVANTVSRNAFETDRAFQAKINEINQASSCLPDAKVNWGGEPDEDGNVVYNVAVEGPVKLMVNAPIAIQPDSSLKVVSTKLNQGGDCYWGNVQGFPKMAASDFSAGTSSFSAGYMMSWFNGCGSSDASSTGSTDNGQFSLFKATRATEQ